MTMKPKLVCTQCGTVAVPKKKTPGYFALELLLYFLLVVPGIAYTAWRISNKKNVCPACSAESMIPVDSPVAQKLMNA